MSNNRMAMARQANVKCKKWCMDHGLRTCEICGSNFGCGEKAVWDPQKQWFRYLTPVECERLQGFPDGYTEGVSNADRYWALENAVNCKMSDYLFNDYLKGIWW